MRKSQRTSQQETQNEKTHKIVKSGVNKMWILKNSEDLLETLSSRSQCVCNSITTFDFSTLYTTIPHTVQNSRNKELIQRCFSQKNGEYMYQYFVIGGDKFYFQNLITNIYRTRSFKYIISFRTHIYPVWWTSVCKKRSVFQWYELCSTTRRFASTCL